MIFKEAIIFLNKFCNFNCYHCYVKKKNIEFNFKLLSEFLKTCNKNHGVERVSLIGGEPFLYSKLIPLLIDLKNRNEVEIVITTNGSIYNNKVIELLKNVNLKLLKISFHSLDPKVFSSFTNTKLEQFEIVLDNIKKFSKQFNIGINITATKSNYTEIDTIIKFFANYGIRHFYISQLTLSGKGVEISNEELNKKEIKLIKKRLNDLKFDYDMSINLDDHSSCSFGTKLSLDPSGDIFPCPGIISYQKYRIGCMNSTNAELSGNIKALNQTRTEKCFIKEFINN